MVLVDHTFPILGLCTLYDMHLQYTFLNYAPSWQPSKHCLLKKLAETRPSHTQMWLVIGAGRGSIGKIYAYRVHSTKSLYTAMNTVSVSSSMHVVQLKIKIANIIIVQYVDSGAGGWIGSTYITQVETFHTNPCHDLLAFVNYIYQTLFWRFLRDLD